MLLAGCSSGDGDAGAEASASSAVGEPRRAATIDDQAIAKTDQLLLPSETIYRAENELVRQCMAKKGFTFTAPEYRQESVRAPELTLSAARQSGYDSLKTAEDEVNGPDSAREGYQEALAGNPDSEAVTVDGLGSLRKDSCRADAYQNLYGSIEAGMTYAGGILNYPLPYQNAALLDDEMAEATGKWSTCMKDDYGLAVQTPDEIGVDPAPAKSVETAVKDATCREKTGYESAYTRVLNAYMTSFLEDNQALITQMTDARRTAESKAGSILGGQ